MNKYQTIALTKKTIEDLEIENENGQLIPCLKIPYFLINKVTFKTFSE